jgi:hypothetical protein
MKLRIKGNSLRLRISQSEMQALLRDGEIEDTIRFGPAHDACLTYALRLQESSPEIGLDYRPQRVTILLSNAAATHWAGTDEVGIYGDSASGIALLVEKDFACLDSDDPQYADAFPNPKAGVAC